MILDRYGRKRLGVRTASLMLVAAGMLLIGTMIEPTVTVAKESTALMSLTHDMSGACTR